MGKTREEVLFRATTSKNGSFAPHLSAEVSKMIFDYCQRTNQNRTKFVEQCVIEQIDNCHNKFLLSKTKDELIEMILGK